MTNPETAHLSAAKQALLAERLKGRPTGMRSSPALKDRSDEMTKADFPHVNVPLSPNMPPKTLFYVAPHEPSLIALRHLVHSLGDNWEVVGLLSGRLGERIDPSKTIESIAEKMLAEIRVRQPHGPYLISGLCSGGLVAYELGRRLRVSGEIVGWLGLLDTAEPSEVMRRNRTRAALAQSRAHLLHRAMLRLRGWLNWHLFWIRPFPSDQFDFLGARAMSLRYAIVGHDAPIDVFISDSYAAGYGRSGGWDRLHKGELLVHSVPGDHGSIQDPPQTTAFVEVLNERVQQIYGHNLHAGT